ncbi:MAG: nucleoside triphosphate pyrophosphohydrolase, partial [Oscillospiraceae bacterium]|nr:nucleoside triphosphate pyrophosphohydrolase [Oscillospiraceae bacterium]
MMKDFVCKEQYDLSDFIALIAFLRSENGCPWDRVQTHESIRRNLLEECYELCETLDLNDTEHMKEELGDVLMQVLFHTSIEQDAGHFDIDDVADRACKKLVSRHPNLFGGETGMDWDQLKRAERGEETVSDSMRSVSAYLPALWRAEKIQKKMAKTGFDWPDVESALRKVEEETQELREGIANNDRENMIEEVGDLLLTVVDVARICGIDPEMAL